MSIIFDIEEDIVNNYGERGPIISTRDVQCDSPCSRPGPGPGQGHYNCVATTPSVVQQSWYSAAAAADKIYCLIKLLLLDITYNLLISTAED